MSVRMCSEMWSVKGADQVCFYSVFTFISPALLKQFQPHTDTINSIQLFNRTERLLILTASSDCAVALWDIEGRHIGIFGQVNSQCFGINQSASTECLSSQLFRGWKKNYAGVPFGKWVERLSNLEVKVSDVYLKVRCFESLSALWFTRRKRSLTWWMSGHAYKWAPVCNYWGSLNECLGKFCGELLSVITGSLLFELVTL